MDPILSSILCGLASDVVTNVSCKVFDNISKKTLEQEIKQLFSEKLKNSLITIKDNGLFEKYMNSPQISDLLQNYIFYKMTGEWTFTLKNISKKNKLVVTEKAIIDYVVTNFSVAYELELTEAYKKDLVEYLSILFSSANEFIVSKMKLEHEAITFLINNRIDNSFILLDEKITELGNKITKSLELSIISKNYENEKIKTEYIKCLKHFYEKGFVYLMGEYSFSKFYIPPTLKRYNDRNKNLERIFYDKKSYHLNDNIIWTDIFSKQDTVYIIGGAGFGKSLFLKNIINNYDKLKINTSNDYLVIYCELKTFYANGELKKSIIEFIQESMISITGIDKSKISKEFIQYYLDIGRCILLFDALDEVTKEYRARLHKMIINFFQNCNPNNKICITSRDRGFIPQDEIEVIKICPLNEDEISKYIDKIIDLKKFKREDKPTFMSQTSTLMQKNFLNNFLVLSLLVNIYKSERELPENKVDLYKKCFEYIAKKREEEKSKIGYNWELISPIMKDSTFIELSKLGFPNNIDIDRIEVEKTLLTLYKSKFADECKAEYAIKEFLDFCSNRTELFVPSSSDDKFKFFHRSFFEYFYSKYIYQQPSSESIYNLMSNFDVDSEVFELTVAMIKEDNELKYQELVEYILNKVENDFKTNYSFIPINMLTLVMQVVDDELYLKKYIELLITNNKYISNNLKKLKNQNIIEIIVNKIIKKDYETKQRFVEAYEKALFIRFLLIFSQIDKNTMQKIDSAEFSLTSDGFRYFTSHFIFLEYPFYFCILKILDNSFEFFEKYVTTTFGEINNIINDFVYDKKSKNLVRKGFKLYSMLSLENRRSVYKSIFDRYYPCDITE